MLTIDKDQLKTGAIILPVLLVLGGAIWLPASWERDRLQARQAAAQATLAQEGRHAESLPQLYRQVNELQERAATLKQRVPEKDELAEVLRGVTEALQLYDVEERQVEAGTPQPYRDYTVAPIELEFDGTFLTAYGVMRHIESLPRLVRIDSVELKPLSEKPAEGEARDMLKVRMELSTFFTDGSRKAGH